MTLPLSLAAYEDCTDYMQRAIDAEKGIRVKVPDHGSAMRLRSRLHMARSLDRKNNRDLLPEDDPLYGKSEFDPLVVRFEAEGDEEWVRIEKMSAIAAAEHEVEEL